MKINHRFAVLITLVCAIAGADGHAANAWDYYPAFASRPVRTGPLAGCYLAEELDAAGFVKWRRIKGQCLGHQFSDVSPKPNAMPEFRWQCRLQRIASSDIDWTGDVSGCVIDGQRGGHLPIYMRENPFLGRDQLAPAWRPRNRADPEDVANAIRHGWSVSPSGIRTRWLDAGAGDTRADLRTIARLEASAWFYDPTAPDFKGRPQEISKEFTCNPRSPISLRSLVGALCESALGQKTGARMQVIPAQFDERGKPFTLLEARLASLAPAKEGPLSFEDAALERARDVAGTNDNCAETWAKRRARGERDGLAIGDRREQLMLLSAYLHATECPVPAADSFQANAEIRDYLLGAPKYEPGKPIDRPTLLAQAAERTARALQAARAAPEPGPTSRSSEPDFLEVVGAGLLAYVMTASHDGGSHADVDRNDSSCLPGCQNNCVSTNRASFTLDKDNTPLYDSSDGYEGCLSACTFRCSGN